MSDAERSGPSPRRRALGFLKWGLIAVALLVVINGAVGAWTESRNQARLEAFYEAIGARSMRELVGGSEGAAANVPGNSWFLLLGAVAALSPRTVDRYGAAATPGPTVPAGRRAARETELDLGHGMIERARALGAPRPWIDFEHPNELRTPAAHSVLSFFFATLHSAGDAHAGGADDVVCRRLVDGLTVIRSVLSNPMAVEVAVQALAVHHVTEWLAPRLQQLSEATLRAVDDALARFDLRPAFVRAMHGEVFFGVAVWETVKRGELEGLPIPTLARAFPVTWIEMDFSAYFDQVLPRAIDPWQADFGTIEFPFYAHLSRLIAPTMEAVKKTIASEAARHALLREAIRLELARRTNGTIPSAAAARAGETIVTEPGDEAVTLTAPATAGDGAPALRVVLKHAPAEGR